MATPLRILMVYHDGSAALRPTTREHLEAFRRYSPHRVDYLNLERECPPGLGELNRYDLIVFHYLFLTHRWGGASAFRHVLDRAGDLRYARTRKIMLPQDEFLHADLLGEFIREFEIDAVFSVAPASEWAAIYRTVDFQRVLFSPVLTGYIDDGAVAAVQAMRDPTEARPIGVGYRTAGRPYFWFGRHGYLKEQIAHVFQKRAPEKGLTTDISVEGQDTVLGDDWYRFLLRCRYTIGVEGGTSLVDWDGSIKARTERYLRHHPGAGFDEVERACFPGLDGTVRLFALSPRHLEACVTRTAQVLVEGRYNGVLRPGEHYLPLRRDFSNIDAVLEAMQDERARSAMADRAFGDVVASGRYSYRRFVEEMTETAMACPLAVRRPRPLWRLDRQQRRCRGAARGVGRRLARAVGWR